MYKTGDVVYHDELYFNDKIKDNKKKRPCVVLFETTIDNKEYVCTCPLTSQVKTFNKNHNNYIFIPQVIYKYEKLSFAKVNSTSLKLLDNTHSTSISVDDRTVLLIKRKILTHEYENMEDVKYHLILNEQKLISEEKELKKERKNLRKELKRQMKHAN